MTEDNAKNKLTLSGKSTLTLKGVGSLDKTHNRDGKKVVQVEVRKKRVINPGAVKTENKVEIDEETAAKLRLIAEAKEYENKRRQEEEERALQRQKMKEQEEAERRQRELEEQSRAQQAEKAKETVAAVEEEPEVKPLSKIKDKKSKDFDDEDDDEDFGDKKSKKVSSREDVFEQERKKVTKRSFEPQRRSGKLNVHNISADDDDDDYGFGGRRRYKKKQPKPVQIQQPQEKVIREVVIPEIITVQELANRMAEKSADVIKKLMGLFSAIRLANS